MRYSRLIALGTPLGGATLFVVIWVVIGIACTTALAEDLTVTLVSIISPIGWGEQQTLVVQTEPGATCQAKPVAGNVTVNFSQHEAKDNGRVRWSWVVRGPKNGVKHGLEIICTLGDRKGRLLTEFTVR